MTLLSGLRVGNSASIYCSTVFQSNEEESLTGPQIFVTVVLAAVIVLIYSRKLTAPVIFISAAAVLTIGSVITPAEALAGFANDAIAVMLMLIILSEIMRKTGFLEWIFERKMNISGSYRTFLSQMMPFVAGSSAFMNNTPIVAMMIPFVGDWGKKHGIPASKLLIPLSWAAILGGTVTLIGTSTNMIVNSLVVGSGHTELPILAFAPVGLMLLTGGMLYIILFAWRLLPARKNPSESFAESPREYVTNLILQPGSSLVGKTVEEAKLRNIKGLFLVEIIREERAIAPVSPSEELHAGDELVLAGITSAVAELAGTYRGLKPTPGFELPDHEKLEVIEVVVSSRSTLMGMMVRDTDFRGRYNAAILAVHRQGEKLGGKIGEIRLRPGDLLLLVTGGDFGKRVAGSDDLFVISMIREIHNINLKKSVFILVASFSCIVLSILGLVPLFKSLLALLAVFLISGILSLPELKRSLNMNLLVIAAFALAVGRAVDVTGLGALFSDTVVHIFEPLGTVGVLAAVYIVTNLLADFITTAAAASIVFPFAASAAVSLGIDGTPFFLAVAYGAAANFITPIGYQTNLMVYGPGGYRFKDFMKAGLPLKIICAIIAIGGLALVYGL
ncbi:SLC13 family permease [Candidatus Fermentibacteria bacterium]|nr:MAG: SLC13 family permease [Candidatus Fermentibacteria bacterium]